jgi:hypothetical protein
VLAVDSSGAQGSGEVMCLIMDVAAERKRLLEDERHAKEKLGL